MVSYHHKVPEPSLMPEIFLSFCIPTYNRAAKLKRFLEQLIRILSVSQFRENVEVVISNNASSDNTEDVINCVVNYLRAICPTRCHLQKENIGSEANFKFLYEHANGAYVWMCADDDILYEEEFDRLCNDLMKYRPEVCMSSFKQPPMTDENRLFMCSGNSVELVTEPRYAADCIIKYPKITAYVYKRHQLSDTERTITDRGIETSYWFITLAIFLFIKKERKLLLRSANIAQCDDDYLNLRYSPRVFRGLKDALLIGLGQDELSRYFIDMPIPNTDDAVVGLLFKHCLGRIKMDLAVVREDFEYIKKNWLSLMSSHWKNCIKVFTILILFPVVLNRQSRK